MGCNTVPPAWARRDTSCAYGSKMDSPLTVTPSDHRTPPLIDQLHGLNRRDLAKFQNRELSSPEKIPATQQADRRLQPRRDRARSGMAVGFPQHGGPCSRPRTTTRRGARPGHLGGVGRLSPTHPRVRRRLRHRSRRDGGARTVGRGRLDPHRWARCGRSPATRRRAKLHVGQDPRRDALSTRSPREVDDVAARSGLAVSQMQAALGALELAGREGARERGWIRIG